MPRKKAKKKKGTRRRVGAMALSASSPVVQFGSIGVGWLMADTINTQIVRFTGTMDGKMVGGITAGIGAALQFMKLGKKPKSTLQVAAGGVLIGAGAKKLLKEMGVINGYSAVPVVGTGGRMNGYHAVPVVNGYKAGPSYPSSLNGALNGYKVPRPANIVGNAGSSSGITNTGGGNTLAA
jgi:hypothetical protein